MAAMGVKPIAWELPIPSIFPASKQRVSGPFAPILPNQIFTKIFFNKFVKPTKYNNHV